MTDEEFKQEFNTLRTQEVRMAYLLKGVQKAYQQMPNKGMNPALHRHDLVKGSETMTVEDSVRLYFQMHLAQEIGDTVKEMVLMTFYLCNQTPETLTGYAVAMHNTFAKLLMLIDQYEGKERNCIEFFD